MVQIKDVTLDIDGIKLGSSSVSRVTSSSCIIMIFGISHNEFDFG